MRRFVLSLILVLILTILNPVITMAGKGTTYNYLPNGKLESVVYPDGTKIIYVYDKNGNVKEVSVDKNSSGDNNKKDSNDKQSKAESTQIVNDTDYTGVL